MKKYILIFVLLLLSACTTPLASVNPSGEVSQTPTATWVVLPTPTTDPSMGMLRGRLTLKGQAVSSGIIYLAEVIKDEQGNEIVASFSRESPLRAYPDTEGNFVFVNVPAGRYGMVYDQVATAALLMFPDREESLIVTINAGEDQDLGLLDYQTLPGFSE